jgi:hypothetical protein
VPNYLRQLWLSGDPAGNELLHRWYLASRTLLAELVEAGIMRPGTRPEVRAAVLMANDLAVLLLREGLAEILQGDPLSHTLT